LNSGSRSDTDEVLPLLRQGLRDVGFIEGRNVSIEGLWAENQFDRLPALAAELVQRRVAVIVTASGVPSVAAAKAASATIPIVFMMGPDPVRTGVVARLNRPGSNVTGVTLLSADLIAKRLGLLHDLVPQATAITVLLTEKGDRDSQIFQLQ